MIDLGHLAGLGIVSDWRLPSVASVGPSGTLFVCHWLCHCRRLHISVELVLWVLGENSWRLNLLPAGGGGSKTAGVGLSGLSWGVCVTRKRLLWKQPARIVSVAFLGVLKWLVFIAHLPSRGFTVESLKTAWDGYIFLFVTAISHFGNTQVPPVWGKR